MKVAPPEVESSRTESQLRGAAFPDKSGRFVALHDNKQDDPNAGV